ncbi:hypothetical protein NDU88_004401 [Pleurodeles waltl]|uniref:Uncharacterized protein n=1 Tax=Pleurodeles waltl TaxID=8319 RepID=A0AAV7T910_PLEWA|nr:hypothetical protein NDU88_004401 [Pleurodeles waltl]
MIRPEKRLSSTDLRVRRRKKPLLRLLRSQVSWLKLLPWTPVSILTPLSRSFDALLRSRNSRLYFQDHKKIQTSEPKKASYTEEQGLSSRLKQASKPMQESYRPSDEDTEIERIVEVMDERHSRIHIHKETGRIITAPPLKTKRKLAFQEELDSVQPPAKIQKQKEKPVPVPTSRPHPTQLSFSPPHNSP